MDLFALAARLTLDTSGYEAGLLSAEAGLDGFAARLETGLTAAERLTEATGAAGVLAAGSMVDQIAEIMSRPVAEAAGWGRDLVDGFAGGIYERGPALTAAVSGLAETVRRYLHFSEPDEGPLADFHTYAPDMMALFAQGIRENTDLVTEQVGRSFDFGPQVVREAGAVDAGREVTVPREAAARPVNVVFELDGVQQWVYRLNQAEEQRVGVRLAKGVL